MENAMILLYDFCRLCLDEPGVENIFKPVDWTQDIFYYTGIKVEPSDKLPQTICTSCRDIITCVKVLKDLASTNDKRLQAIHCSNIESADVQVLMTNSLSHLVIISTPNPCDDSQNNSTEPQEITSSSVTVNESFKSRIIYEDNGTKELNSKTEKQNTKKRKSSSQPENIRTAKLIAVRKDLFVTSPTVTSSSKTIKSCPKKHTLEVSPVKVDDKAGGSSKVVSSTKKRQLPSTPSPSKDLGKIAKGEIEHVCETCNKTYGTSKKLYLHRLAHNKKYICPLDTCGKKFATKGDLQKHIRSHTGERPFKCNLCEHSFTQRVSLKAHKENIHSEPLSQG